MAESRLEIKIRALVEGLREVQGLGAEMGRLGQQSTQAGLGASNAQDDLADLGKQATVSDATLEDLAQTLTELGAQSKDLDFGDAGLSQKVSDLSNTVGQLVNHFGKLPPAAAAAGAMGAKGITPATVAIDALLGKVKLAIAAFITFAGVMSLKEAADTAARTETLGVTLGIIGNNAGYSAEQLAKYEEELKNLGITTGAARESLTQLIQAGINLDQVNDMGVSKAAELARAAQDLAVVTGENSSITLQKLITNIRQMDSQGLKYMGLTVDIQAAQNKFAQSIGKTADSLSIQQKQQAVMNATMEEATKLTGSYQGALGTVGKQLGSMARFQEEAANAVGNTLLPAYAAIVAEATEFLKVVAETAKLLDSQTDFAESFGGGLGEAAEGVRELLSSIVTLGGNMAPAFGSLVNSSGELLSNLLAVAESLVVAVDKTNILEGSIRVVSGVLAALSDGLKFLGGLVSFVASGWADALAFLALGLSQIVGLINEDAAAGLRNVANELGNMAEASRKSSAQVVADFEKSDSALQKWWDSLKGVKKELAEFGKASTFQEVEAQIREMTSALRNGDITNIEAFEGADLIIKNLKQMASEGKITGQEMAILSQRTISSVKGIQDAYTTAVNELDMRMLVLGSKSYMVPINKELEKTSGYLMSLSELPQTTSDQFAQAFSKGLNSAKTIVDIENVSASLTKANLRLFDTTNSVKELRIKLNETFDQNLKDANTVQGLEMIVLLLAKMQERGDITLDEFSQKMVQVGDRWRELEKELGSYDLAAPLAALGLDINLLGTGLTQAGIDGAKALAGIVTGMLAAKDATRLTGDQFLEVFNGGLDNAKTLNDLSLYVQELERAKAGGKVFGDTYKSALTEVSGKFEELFQAQLKSANTKTEFDALRKNVEAVGKTGGATATQVALALEQITEAATRAKEATLETAKQQTEASKQQTTVAKAELDVMKASATLEREQRTLAEMTARAKKDNTKESRALLDVQQKVVKQAEAEKRLSELKYRFEVAQMNALIAKQRQLNAERVLSLDPTNESAQQAARAAGEEASRRELAAEQAARAVASQEELVVKTEEAVVKAKELADAMGATADNAGKAGDDVGKNVTSITKVMTVAGHSMESVTQALIEAGLSLDKAKSMAYDLMDGQQRMSGFGAEGIARYHAINKAIYEATLHQKELEEKAGEVTEEFQRQANSAQLIADGVITAAQATELFDKNANSLQRAMADVKIQAYQVAKAASDAAVSFQGSFRGLQEELLSAQGKEDEVAKMRFENRRQELALEYQMLQAKLQSAIATGKAAGISTTDLESTLAGTKKTYAESLAIINQLEKIDSNKRKEQAAKAKEDEARRKKEDEAKQKALEDQGREKERQATKESEAAEKLSEQRIEDIREQGAVQEEVIQGSLEARLKALNTADPLSDFAQSLMAGLVDNSTQSSSVQSIARTGATSPMLNSVDVSKVTLQIGGKSQDVFTRPGEKDGLLGMLADISNRS